MHFFLNKDVNAWMSAYCTNIWNLCAFSDNLSYSDENCDSGSVKCYEMVFFIYKSMELRVVTKSHVFVVYLLFAVALWLI